MPPLDGAIQLQTDGCVDVDGDGDIDLLDCPNGSPNIKNYLYLVGVIIPASLQFFAFFFKLRYEVPHPPNMCR